jgi:hypothetical protein
MLCIGPHREVTHGQSIGDLTRDRTACRGRAPRARRDRDDQAKIEQVAKALLAKFEAM